ncbi:MAG: hypothetical protein U0800_08360 [Isosphaeraceae bacterium]
MIIELTSRTTRREDQVKKLALYRDVLKVPEYFLFDPTQDYLRPSLQGYRLAGDAYEPIRQIHGRIRCDGLGLDLGREGQMLRLYDAATGHRLPTRAERIDEERQRAEHERQRAEHERQRAEHERQVADRERLLTGQERQRAEQERQRAEQAEAENQRLLREIEQLRRRLDPNGTAGDGLASP